MIRNIAVRLSKIIRASVIILSAAILLTTLPASAAPVDTNARYVVSLGGVNIATIKIAFKDENNRYNIDLSAAISGIGSLVVSGNASAGTSGSSLKSSLTPNRLDIETRSRGNIFSLAVQYSRGNASGFQVNPPVKNTINRVPIERKHLTGVTDPIGSFILKGKKLDAQLCNRRLKVFSGLERFDIKMSFAEAQTATSTRTAYQGPVILCKIKYVPVSGHYSNSAMTSYLASSKRFLIWYAPLGESGYFIPYRVLIGTSAGDLSMVLTGLK